MELPVGMLIYWAHRFSDDHSVICGIWYYKEMYVPSTVEEKMQSVSDIKSKRCRVLNLSGTFDQILDLLMQCDKFQHEGDLLISQFNKLKDELIASIDKPVIFDDIKNVKGTSLVLDTQVEVDTNIEDIQLKIAEWKKAIDITISKDWSFGDDLLKSFESFK